MIVHFPSSDVCCPFFFGRISEGGGGREENASVKTILHARAHASIIRRRLGSYIATVLSSRRRRRASAIVALLTMTDIARVFVVGVSH